MTVRAAPPFAQLAAWAYAFGHAVDIDRGVPGNACELCLVAHDLGTALLSLAALAAADAPGSVVEKPCTPACGAFPPPAARPADLLRTPPF